jgi:hypothetical protein
VETASLTANSAGDTADASRSPKRGAAVYSGRVAINNSLSSTCTDQTTIRPVAITPTSADHEASEGDCGCQEVASAATFLVPEKDRPYILLSQAVEKKSEVVRPVMN